MQLAPQLCTVHWCRPWTTTTTSGTFTFRSHSNLDGVVIAYRKGNKCTQSLARSIEFRVSKNPNLVLFSTYWNLFSLCSVCDVSFVPVAGSINHGRSWGENRILFSPTNRTRDDACENFVGPVYEFFSFLTWALAVFLTRNPMKNERQKGKNKRGTLSRPASIAMQNCQIKSTKFPRVLLYLLYLDFLLETCYTC